MSSQLANMTIGQIRNKAREDAERVLTEYWASRLFPVDPVRIARSLGASVFSADLDADTWGMLVGTNEGPAIYLDRNQPVNRYRFSCAHEVGHLIDREADIAQGKAIVERRSAPSGHADEIYANEFAGSLLMPRTELVKAIQSGDDSFELAQRFQVSYDAVQYRRRLLGV